MMNAEEAHPYRSALSTLDAVDTEMRSAVGILYQWRKYNPIIAGGCLWSWAAGKRARDVDLFLYEGWLAKSTRRKVCRWLGNSNLTRWGDEYDNGYERLDVAVNIEVYKATIPNTDTPLDVVITPWKDGEITTHFDYSHCCVAFGPNARVEHGIRFYKNAEFITQNHMHRNLTYVTSKLQTSLWGNPEARPAMLGVLDKLADMYKRAAKES